MPRTKTIELINTIVTITTGQAVSTALIGKNWHEALFPLIVSGVDATHAVDIEVSADEAAWVPAKDLNDNVLSNIVAPAVYIMSGKMNYIRVSAITVTDTTSNPLVQMIRSE